LGVVFLPYKVLEIYHLKHHRDLEASTLTIMQSMGFKRKFKKGMFVRVIVHNANSFERIVSRYQRIIRKRNRRTDNTMAKIKRT